MLPVSPGGFASVRSLTGVDFHALVVAALEQKVASGGSMAGGGESARRPRAGLTGPRNVRTPQGKVLGNTQSR